MRKSMLLMIRLYQMAVSPYLKGYCRHMPSCSSYTHEAISRHGPLTGIMLSARRLARCQPLGTRGYDPVP